MELQDTNTFRYIDTTELRTGLSLQSTALHNHTSTESTDLPTRPPSPRAASRKQSLLQLNGHLGKQQSEPPVIRKRSSTGPVSGIFGKYKQSGFLSMEIHHSNTMPHYNGQLILLNDTHSAQDPELDDDWNMDTRSIASSAAASHRKAMTLQLTDTHSNPLRLSPLNSLQKSRSDHTSHRQNRAGTAGTVHRSPSCSPNKAPQLELKPYTSLRSRNRKSKSYDPSDAANLSNGLDPYHMAVASYSSVGPLSAISSSVDNSPSSVAIDDAKEPSPAPLSLGDVPEAESVSPKPVEPLENSISPSSLKSPVPKRDPVSVIDYLALTASAMSTWSFYNIFIAFWMWQSQDDEYNDGDPSSEWLSRYQWTVISYLIFIWFNIALNPFYLHRFRSSLTPKSRVSDIDINTKNGMIRLCVRRMTIICAFIYCLAMTAFCFNPYDGYMMRLDHIQILYVHCPAIIVNVIVSGYLLKRQPGFFMMFHFLFFLALSAVVFITFSGFSKGWLQHGLSMDIDLSIDAGFYWTAICGTFCVYLVMAVSIKSAATYHESKLDGMGQQIPLHIHQMVSSPYSIEAMQSAGAIVKKGYKDKPIKCCCGRFEIDLSPFFRLQALISAVTFWGFWSVVSIVDDSRFDTVTELIFVIACSCFNPMYYSTTNRVTQKSSKTATKCLFTAYFITGYIFGVIQCGIFVLYWYVVLAEMTLQLPWCSVSDFLCLFEINEPNVRCANFLMACFISLLFYFPSTGYLFFRAWLDFGLLHLFCAVAAVFIPLTITDFADRPLFSIGKERFGMNDIADNINGGGMNQRATVLIFFLLVFALFLSLSGFSCTYFRFRKVLVESQSIVTGYKSSVVREQRREYPLTLTMFITLVLSFGDFCTDVLYALLPLAISGVTPGIRYCSVCLLCIQVLIQAFSLQSVILKVRSQLHEHHAKHQLKRFREWLYGIMGTFGLIVLYPLCWIIYYVFLILLSISLGLTKLMAIQQVQQWWFSLIIVNYQEIANKRVNKVTRHKRKMKETLENIGKRRNQSVFEMNVMNSRDMRDVEVPDVFQGPRLASERASVEDFFQSHARKNSTNIIIDGYGYGLNDVHDTYWAVLDQIYVQQADGQQMKFDDDSSSGSELDTVWEERQDTDRGDIIGENAGPIRVDTGTLDDVINRKKRKDRNRKKRRRHRTDRSREEKRDERGAKKLKKRKKKEKEKEKEDNKFGKVWLGWDTDTDDLGLIFKIYLWIDQYTPRWMRYLYINANVYNTYFVTELIVESLPQCILIVTDTYLKGAWSEISVASIMFSGIMIAYNVLKIVYYVGYMGQDMRSVVL